MQQLKENHKIFHCENGKAYGAHEMSCFFCKHCTDIFWDYTNGPYMLMCELPDTDDENQKSAFRDGGCEKFEQDET